MSIPERRILMVEDKPEWRDALEDAYRSILGERYELEFFNAGSSNAAIEELQRAAKNNKPYHLLSLDINLGRGATAFDDGRDVINEVTRRANSGQKVCLAAIIVTGIATDDELRLEPDFPDLLMTLPEFLKRHFGERGYFLQKAGQGDPFTTCERLKKKSSQNNKGGEINLGDIILNLCRPYSDRSLHFKGRIKKAGEKARKETTAVDWEQWTMTFGETSMTIEDSTGGLRAIAELLNQPGREWAYPKLFLETSNPSADGRAAGLREEGLTVDVPRTHDEKDSHPERIMAGLDELEAEKKALFESTREAEAKVKILRESYGELGAIEARADYQELVEEIERNKERLDEIKEIEQMKPANIKLKPSDRGSRQRFYGDLYKRLTDAKKKIAQHLHSFDPEFEKRVRLVKLKACYYGPEWDIKLGL
jgi:CheY-like chemotaxis protein